MDHLEEAGHKACQEKDHLERDGHKDQEGMDQPHMAGLRALWQKDNLLHLKEIETS